MWRIIKAEFSYMKWWLLISWLGLYALASFNYQLRGSMEDVLMLQRNFGDRVILSPVYYAPIESASIFLGLVLLVNVISILAMTYLDIRERRIETTATLPVPIVYIAIARLLAPFLVLPFLFLATLLPNVFATIVLPVDAAREWQMLSPLYMETFVDIFIIFPSICLFLTYSIRLATERVGRYMLGAYIVFIFTQYYILPIFGVQFAWNSLDAVSRGFNMSKYLWNNASAWLTPVFVICIFLSFITRRSYARP